MSADIAKALDIACATHAGMVRTHNEDTIGADPSIGLAVLADGMGGYNAGEVASSIAVALITKETRELAGKLEVDHGEGIDESAVAAEILQDSIARANSSIYHAAGTQPQYAGMGTTLVVALFTPSRISVAHVGDSRLYRLRGSELVQLTRDHSLLQEQIDSGIITKEMARRSQNKNLVTRAVGIEPSVEAEINAFDVREGDTYLLCSDGLNDMVEDEDILLTLSSLQQNLPLAANQLVQLANDNGGRDNVSVILVRVKKTYPAAQGLLGRLKTWFGKNGE
ncbi:MAG TPA: Stp1/IreP family PP2C-type Ser/Thr phosphatase [Burkholderiales bacterium]|nr:Stp1/IreP family PP2C-type Ser/Thr phosphatase [Burkholderiales bacterium]